MHLLASHCHGSNGNNMTYAVLRRDDKPAEDSPQLVEEAAVWDLLQLMYVEASRTSELLVSQVTL